MYISLAAVFICRQISLAAVMEIGAEDKCHIWKKLTCTGHIKFGSTTINRQVYARIKYIKIKPSNGFTGWL